MRMEWNLFAIHPAIPIQYFICLSDNFSDSSLSALCMTKSRSTGPERCKLQTHSTHIDIRLSFSISSGIANWRRYWRHSVQASSLCSVRKPYKYVLRNNNIKIQTYEIFWLMSDNEITKLWMIMAVIRAPLKKRIPIYQTNSTKRNPWESGSRSIDQEFLLIL
jgi:hypothetical protein